MFLATFDQISGQNHDVWWKCGSKNVFRLDFEGTGTIAMVDHDSDDDDLIIGETCTEPANGQCLTQNILQKYLINEFFMFFFTKPSKSY